MSGFINDMTLQLYSGDVDVLCPGGITDAVSADNRLYGLERVADVAPQHR